MQTNSSTKPSKRPPFKKLYDFQQITNSHLNMDLHLITKHFYQHSNTKLVQLFLNHLISSVNLSSPSLKVHFIWCKSSPSSQWKRTASTSPVWATDLVVGKSTYFASYVNCFHSLHTCYVVFCNIVRFQENLQDFVIGLSDSVTVYVCECLSKSFAQITSQRQ